MQRRKKTSSEIPSGDGSGPATSPTRKVTSTRKVKRCTMVGLALLGIGAIFLAVTIYYSVDWTVRKFSPPVETSSKWTHQHNAAKERERKAKPLPQPWKIKPKVLSKEFPANTKCQEKPRLTRDVLDKSLALGTKFLLEHQKSFGNFDYEYDWTTGVKTDDDMEVRQAGALWGLSLIFHDMMDTFDSDDPDSLRVLHIVAVHLLRAFEFFVMQNSEILEFNGVTMRYITYPDSEKHGIGTMGLVSLAIVEFLRATGDNVPEYVQMKLISPHKREELESMLRQLLAFLVSSHSATPIRSLEDRFRTWNKLISGANWKSWQTQEDQYKETGDGGGYFLQNYDNEGLSSGISSSYYDGECLLAIVKAAKYLEYNFLFPMAVGTAKSLHHRHVTMALKEDEDSAETKGFYQWSSMAFFELATVEFEESEEYYDPTRFGSWLVDLALWMVDVHGTLGRPKNTGYAYEGIVPAWSYAATSGSNTGTAQHLHCTIEEGMARLISWQVGMGLVENSVDDWDGQKGLGGVQNSLKEPGLRIDTTQHQMHATILARRLVYPEPNTWPWSTELFVRQ
eukprot:CAMPEP_0194211102 /NCGR_PEP_ID=MMETSP0156-20130528/9380_1 /TAXON_ID=33649 /ORGANISM="Thalassionema nitzschioides, Strain L26-B" /LENGTH=565 /DNA_ID=CAMNT_0038938543 /DNA_START=101 /DNA_END=1798 /DNA_ORIENTATION=+